MSVTERPVRVTFVLDAQIPLERLILERLGGLNRRAQQSWLRGLVVEGFLLESRAVHIMRESPLDVSRAKSPRSAPYRLSPRFMGNAKSEPNLAPAAAMSTRSPDDKPFAALRRVIG